MNELEQRLGRLETEKQNMNTIDIDLGSTKEVLEIINREDQTVAYRIAEKMDEITALTDAYVKTIQQGGRVFYIGAGTSGRLAFVDAAELIPTYGIPEGLVEGIMCGGLPAMRRAKEHAEDHAEEGTHDLKERGFCEKDMLIGVAASGRTPYVVNGLTYAKSLGALTGSISCVSNAEISAMVDYPVEIVVGQEVVLGSTRMKSGTAQKLVLNMVSTAAMIRLGRTYKNYLVYGLATTEKGKIRIIRMLANECGVSFEEAGRVFEETNKNSLIAMCMLKSGYTKEEAEQLLKKYNGRLRDALISEGFETR